ncbi:hypothetical protein PV05_04959 [Exophiala xenobiotica]|uniref:ABM domain-containing protein n=1 Tax=Exophiala xenobiotica TaxID=348802 RepID=A0A0D2F8B8_9EURO|nr:uncharacterized protein PV05_04959 [Exophiala xenobiotica]KIW56289.1 hypothetical protein PV05_04959 [Exophiala xenobiotica]
MGSGDQKAACLTLLHPNSAQAKDKVLHTLVSKASFFRLAEAECLTYTYFTPATRKGANLGMVPSSEKDTMIGVMQIFTSPKAVAEAEQYFKLSEVAANAEDRTKWYPSAGFVARKGEEEAPKAKIVMLAKFICKEGQGMREKLVDVLGKFCDWVEENEPTTLTYCVMTRPEAPNEVLMFERYKDLPALGVHGKSKQFKDMFKATGPFVQGRKTILSEWEELDGSFVSNRPGGAGVPKAKL